MSTTPVPEAAALATALAEIEGLRRALILQLELTDRLRADVVRLDDLNREQSGRLQALEAAVRRRS